MCFGTAEYVCVSWEWEWVWGWLDRECMGFVTTGFFWGWGRGRGGSLEKVPGTPMFFYAIFTIIILMLLNKASGFTIYFTGWRTFFLSGFLFGGEGMAIRTLFTNCFFFPFCYIFFLLFLVTGPIILPRGVYYFLVIWRGFICPLSPNLACKNL